jgi:hypothetical protein
MSAAEKSFTFLQDNLPNWLHDIAALEEKVTAMQDDNARVPVSVSPFAKHESESIESLRPGKLSAIGEEAISQAAQTDPVANRKRKALSAMSGRASGPATYRPRTMVVVSYDGDMQKSFEALVRALATGRNLLRKAKMEARVNEMAAAASSEEDSTEDEEDEEQTSYRPRISSMRTRTAARRNGGSKAPSELFDTTDRILEQAQNRVETAAHLTLREGDCRNELKVVRRDFEDVLDIAKTQVTKSSEMRQLELVEPQSPDTPDTSVSSFTPSSKPYFPHVSTPHPEPEPEPTIATAPIPTISEKMAPKTVDIEVDQGEESDQDFVMPPVRFTSRSPPPAMATISLPLPTAPKTTDIEVDDDDGSDEEDFIMPPVRLMSRYSARV